MTTWFTSDMHFGHVKALELIPLRGDTFGDLDQMNEEIARRWNESVMPGDTVFVLGDAVMGQREKTLPLLGDLNGEKHLIMGNHDHSWPHLWKPSQAEKFGRMVDAYSPYFFQMSTEGGYTLPDGTFVRLHHFPYAGDSHGEDRYSEFRPVDDGTPLLHGHVHDAWQVRTTKDGTIMLNVGVDVHDFRPISEDEVVELMSSLDDKVRP